MKMGSKVGLMLMDNFEQTKHFFTSRSQRYCNTCYCDVLLSFADCWSHCFLFCCYAHLAKITMSGQVKRSRLRGKHVEEFPSSCAQERYSISRPQPQSVRATLPFPLPTDVQGRLDRYEAEVNQKTTTW